MPLTNIDCQHTRECTVAPWMRMFFTEDWNFPVRSDHRRWMFEDSFQISFVDCVKDSAATTAFDKPQCSFRGVIDAQLHSPQPSHISEILSRESPVPSTRRNHYVL